MHEIIEDLQKACTDTAAEALSLLKATTHDHHTAYTRTSTSGTVSNVEAKGVTGSVAELSKEKLSTSMHSPHGNQKDLHAAMERHADSVFGKGNWYHSKSSGTIDPKDSRRGKEQIKSHHEGGSTYSIKHHTHPDKDASLANKAPFTDSEIKNIEAHIALRDRK